VTHACTVIPAPWEVEIGGSKSNAAPAKEVTETPPTPISKEKKKKQGAVMHTLYSQLFGKKR
jgi:hypothetical protein